MTTATETKTFSPGDRVIVARPDLLRQSLKGLETTVVTGGSKVVTIALKDGRRWPIEPKALDLLEPAPKREWQVGDRVRGEHPKTRLLCTGIFHKQGYKYMTLQSPGGTTPILAETAELLTPAEDVVELPCPFTEGDLLDFRGQRWEAGRVQKTLLLTWRVELIDPEPGAGWSPDYLEWPCEEPCPAIAVDKQEPGNTPEPDEPIAPPALDSEAFESVHDYLLAAELIDEHEEFISPDGDPIAYRGWQIITDSLEGHLNSFSVQTPEGQWYSGLTLDGPLTDLDHAEAIAYAKAAIDNAIALAEKLSGQLSLLDAPAVETEVVATDPNDRLAELEQAIDAGLNLINDGIKAIWAAATAIREESLWQLTGHASYVDYCKERWGWGKATAHEHAVAGSVLNTLLLSGVPDSEIPESTRAMMELNKVEPEQRPTVLAEAAASNGGRATAKAVREVAQGDRAASPLGDRLPAEDLADAEAVALGITVYRSDTSPEAIAEGLERGWLVPIAEHRPSPADSAHAAAPPAEGDQSGAEAPPPAAGDSEGVLEPGRFVRVRDRPGAWYVAQRSTADTHVMVWSGAGKYLAHPDELTPGGYCDPAQLEEVARQWLHELVAVLGPEQVRSLLGEVVS